MLQSSEVSNARHTIGGPIKKDLTAKGVKNVAEISKVNIFYVLK